MILTFTQLEDCRLCMILISIWVKPLISENTRYSPFFDTQPLELFLLICLM